MAEVWVNSILEGVYIVSSKAPKTSIALIPTCQGYKQWENVEVISSYFILL